MGCYVAQAHVCRADGHEAQQSACGGAATAGLGAHVHLPVWNALVLAQRQAADV